MKTFYLILINLVVVFLGLFIHGNPPKHYYLVIYPIPIILVAYFLSKLSNHLTILFIYGVFSVWWMVNSGWYNTNKPYFYNNVKKIADQILVDSNGKEFSLKRIGEYDYFENNFANNYIYLLQINGANINNNSKLIYTIYENKNTYTKEE